MWLQGERHAGDQADGNAAARLFPCHAPDSREQVRKCRDGQQVLALAEVIAGGEQEQSGQHIDEGTLDGSFRASVAHAHCEPPAEPAIGEQTELQRRDRVQPSDRRNGRRKQVQHKDQRRIDVDQVGIQMLAGQPPLTELQDRRNVLVERRRQHDRHEQQRRE